MAAGAKVTIKKTRKGTAVRNTQGDAWRPAFLAELAATCNVSESCRVAGVSRKTAYQHRAEDPAFALAWDDAVEEGIEALELAARKRAMTVSDTLAIFLLKAHRPKVYRDGASGQPDDPVTVKHTIEYVNDWRSVPRGDG